MDKESWKPGERRRRRGGDPPTKTLRVRAEGPYFPPEHDFEAADKIVCIVGGTGVTGALSLADSFLTHGMQDFKTSFAVIFAILNDSMALLSDWQGLLAHSWEANGKLRLRMHVSSEHGRLNVDEAIRAELAVGGQPGHGAAWIYIFGPAGLLTAAEDACCDVEAELRAVRKDSTASGFAVNSDSHYAVKWEV